MFTVTEHWFFDAGKISALTGRDSCEDTFDRRACGPNLNLPGLLQTCRQLRTAFPLYFEVNELHLCGPWEFFVVEHEWREIREAVLGFVQAMPETQLSMIRRVCSTVPRTIDLLHDITSLRKGVADGKHENDLRPANILPLDWTKATHDIRVHG